MRQASLTCLCSFPWSFQERFWLIVNPNIQTKIWKKKSPGWCCNSSARSAPYLAANTLHPLLYSGDLRALRMQVEERAHLSGLSSPTPSRTNNHVTLAVYPSYSTLPIFIYPGNWTCPVLPTKCYPDHLPPLCAPQLSKQKSTHCFLAITEKKKIG